MSILNISNDKFLLLLFVLLLTSCDCYVVVEGRIFSTETQLPIENATIEFMGRNKIVKSNKDGYFKIDEQVGFCFDPHVRITKENYKTFDILISGSSDSKTFKIMSEPEFFDYDKPFYPDPNNKETFILGTWIEKYSVKCSFVSDTITFFMDTINTKGEIEKIKHQMQESARIK